MGKKRIQHFHPWPVGSGESRWDRGHGRGGIYQEIIQASIFLTLKKNISWWNKNNGGELMKTHGVYIYYYSKSCDFIIVDVKLLDSCISPKPKPRNGWEVSHIILPEHPTVCVGFEKVRSFVLWKGTRVVTVAVEVISKNHPKWVSWYGKIQFFPGFSELFWNILRPHIFYTVTVSRWPFFSNFQRFAMGFIHQVSFSSLEWSAGRKFGKFWGCAILCAWLKIINLDISKRSCWRIWNLWKLLTGWRR